jgi:hypothetical protein
MTTPVAPQEPIRYFKLEGCPAIRMYLGGGICGLRGGNTECSEVKTCPLGYHKEEDVRGKRKEPVK